MVPWRACRQHCAAAAPHGGRGGEAAPAPSPGVSQAPLLQRCRARGPFQPMSPSPEGNHRCLPASRARLPNRPLPSPAVSRNPGSLSLLRSQPFCSRGRQRVPASPSLSPRISLARSQEGPGQAAHACGRRSLQEPLALRKVICSRGGLLRPTFCRYRNERVRSPRAPIPDHTSIWAQHRVSPPAQPG